MPSDTATFSLGGRIISSKSSITLDLPPSCVEFCPADSSVFVVGTYNLETEEASREYADAETERLPREKVPQSRNGSLVVFRLDGDAPTVVQTIVQPSAILDIHFGTLPQSQDVLGVVSSTGTFSAFKFDPVRCPSRPLYELSTSRIPTVEEGVLFLSFAWHPSSLDTLAITTSDGETYLVKLDPGSCFIKSSRRLAVKNDLECWCTAFSPDPEPKRAENQKHDGAFMVYSGGDDSVLRYLSCTADDMLSQDHEEVGSVESLVGILKKTHSAGVTAVLPLPIVLQSGARVVVTGSYDDAIRVFAIHDVRPELVIQPGKLLAEANLGGGVWRLKVISAEIGASTAARDGCTWLLKLLASCMHAGSRIVNLHIPASGEGVNVDMVGRFEEHKSMNYGSDFTRRKDGSVLVISTSFYDRLLCAWDIAQ